VGVGIGGEGVEELGKQGERWEQEEGCERVEELN